jgi:carboxyl-terminal processing protease
MIEQNENFTEENEQEMQPQNAYERRMLEKKWEKHYYRKGLLHGLLVMAVIALAAGGITLGVLVFGGSSNDSTQAALDGSSGSSESVLEKAQGIWQILETYYYQDEDLDSDAAVEGMYHGLVDSVGDPYTVYYTADEYESILGSLDSQYYGIGAVLSQNADTMVVTITNVYENSPAEEAGLRSGDIIVEADDVTATEVELSELVSHIRGEEGTTVHMVISREGESSTLEFDVERREIEIHSVEHQMLAGQIGYIQISQFEEATAKQFEEALDDLKAQNMKALIVDLRDNTGGLLDSVTEILDDILPEGLLVYTEDKYGNRNEYNATDSNSLDVPLAVLVNEYSASASEIFAGAIKDYKYGTLIGTTTFGKGIVQSILPLDDGSYLKVTVSKYYTPNGNNIHGIGIEPDVELEYEYMSDTDTEYQIDHDNQVQKAVEILNEELK